MRIALVGNPNSGKTTLFNALTGSNQFVGNWPGVTVEKKVGKIRGLKDEAGKGVELVDLPGIYSLSPYTLEEVVARNFILEEKPDAIINIVDGSNLERNLYLTTQILDLGIPVVVAINMMDVVRKNGDKLDVKKLESGLGCPVLEISALKNEGITVLSKEAFEVAQSSKVMNSKSSYTGSVEHALAHIEEAVVHNLEEEAQRFYGIKLFERDAKIQKKLGLTAEQIAHIEEDIVRCESELDDDAESIITNERYAHVASIIGGAYVKKNRGKMTTSDKIDRIVTNRILALPIFGLIMYGVYFISVSTLGKIVTDWTNDTLFGDIVPPILKKWLASAGTADWLSGLVLDGIVAGVGAVIGFVPQMLILFLLLAILEGCGYMARVAFIMDRVFRRFGLSGKSFIPVLIGTGCGIPGVMASRTIESERDRRMTVMTTTFIPCGAKLPIIALIAGALFNGASWVAPLSYFIGIGAILISGIILKKTKMFSGDPAPFVMELPEYRMPTAGNVLRSMWERGWSFIKKAGTVILLSTIVIWFVSNFGMVDGKIGMVENLNKGFLANIGNSIAWIFIPLGFGTWQATVGTITGLVAKENVVGTFGVLYGFAKVAEDGAEFWGKMAQDFTMASAFSLLVFNLLCAPCFAAIGAIKREMNSPKWTWFAIGYQTGFAYAIAFIIYQSISVFTIGFTIWTGLAVIVLALLIYFVVRKDKYKGTRGQELSVNAR